MDGPKKSTVTSSMIDLRAELFRKQEEFKRQKAAGSNFIKGAKTEKSAKVGLWSRQNAGVKARAEKDEKDNAKDDEDDDVYAKSKRALEEKARLYDKLCNSSTIPEEDGSDYYLVDFQKKVIDSIVEDREASRRKEEEEEEDEAEKHALAVEIPEPVYPDEEWIDFKDSFGRDRRCMKKDLDQLMKQDRKLALAQSKKKTDIESVKGTDQLPSLMSSDMYRETMRQKWENEMKELQEKGQEEIHYSNVQFDEIRSHGVGFFQFSKDHETREEQLEDLKKMREKTIDEHARKDRIKDKRKAMMEARLAKVRQRRNLKELPAEVKPESDHGSEDVGPKLSEALLPPSTEDIIKKEEMEKQAEEKRKTHVREWDKEKQKVIPSTKNYIETLREEREQEFAPPSAYFKESKSRVNHVSDNCQVKRPQSFFKTAISASSDRQQSSSASGSIMEDKAPESSTDDECKQTCNHLKTLQSDTESKRTDESPLISPQDQQHTQVIRNADNTWPGSQHDYQNYYYDQTSQPTHYGPGQTQLEIPNFHQQDSYQHFHYPLGQQSYSHQQLVEQYAHIPDQQQYSYLYNTNNHQFPGEVFMNNSLPNNAGVPHLNFTTNTFMNNSLPNNAGVPHLNFTTNTFMNNSLPNNAGVPQLNFTTSTFMNNSLPNNAGVPHLNFTTSTTPITEAASQLTYTSKSTKTEVDGIAAGPKRSKIPKMAIMDMRHVKNEDMPSVDVCSANSTEVTAVPYTPGSFTAAKHLTVQQYEESIVESRLRNQISGTAVLYTAEQMKNQEQLENTTEENKQVAADKLIHDFLSSIRSNNNS